MNKIVLIVKREVLFFRKRWLQVTSAALVSPILYVVAFGWGLGRHVEMHGRPYMDFVLPGIIACEATDCSLVLLCRPKMHYPQQVSAPQKCLPWIEKQLQRNG